MVDEIDDHHRAEHQPDPRRAARLDREQSDEDRDGDRDHIGLEGRR